MAGWRERLLKQAAEAARRDPPLPGPVYVNLWGRRRGGAVSYHPDAFTDLDEAALDASEPSLYAYAGTVRVAAGGCELLDLSAYGARLRRERERETAAECRHRRGLRSGAGRGVL